MTRHLDCQAFWGEPAIAGHPASMPFGVRPSGRGWFAPRFRTQRSITHQEPEARSTAEVTRSAEGASPMPDAASLIRRLFGTPGSLDVDTADLLDQAAEAHAGLLARANGRS